MDIIKGITFNSDIDNKLSDKYISEQSIISEAECLNKNTHVPKKHKYVLANTFSLSIHFYKDTYNYFRRSKLIMFGVLFMDYEIFKVKDKCDKNALITKIENSCLNYTNTLSNEKNISIKWTNDQYLSVYHITCNKIASNIDLQGSIKNIKFANDIINYNLDIDNIPYMDIIEIYPDRYKAILEKIELSKNVVENKKEMTIYRCGKCGHHGTRMMNVYNRSLDEGTNVRITCNKCQHSWME